MVELTIKIWLKQDSIIVIGDLKIIKYMISIMRDDILNSVTRELTKLELE